MKQIFILLLSLLNTKINFSFKKKDGFISLLELKKIGTLLPILDSSPDELTAAFNEADTNKDGKISMDGKTISNLL